MLVYQILQRKQSSTCSLFTFLNRNLVGWFLADYKSSFFLQSGVESCSFNENFRDSRKNFNQTIYLVIA